MILGNKCDMEDKRAVSKERGEAVRNNLFIFCTVSYPQLNKTLGCMYFNMFCSNSSLVLFVYDGGLGAGVIFKNINFSMLCLVQDQFLLTIFSIGER